MSAGMKHKGFGLTHVGKLKPHNEDAHLIAPNLGLYVVCDGLGSHAAGAVASQLACDTIQDYIKGNAGPLVSALKSDGRTDIRDCAIELVHNAIADASGKIFAQAQADPEKKGMGTTVVLVLILRRYAVIAHVGDSRVYLMRFKKLHQLTHDHSSLEVKMRRGQMSAQQILESDEKSLITRAVGTQADADCETLFMELISNDRFLLTTDGLTNHINNKQLQIQLPDDPAEEIVTKLIAMANSRGGKDNITGAIVDIGEGTPRSDSETKLWLDLLGTMDLFQHFSYVELLRLMSNASIGAFQRFANVLSEGEANVELFVLLSGSAQMVKGGQVIGELKPGDFFGEMSMIDNEAAWMDVIIAKNAGVLAIDRRYLLRLLDDEPHLWGRLFWRLTRAIIGRLRHTSDEMGWSALSSKNQFVDKLKRLAGEM